ncbi:glycosyltransferase 87 family protein [Staphylococcus chromogenes]|nr:glycosyltransferase 87 family protein [Staphylococcus chromogenes]
MLRVGTTGWNLRTLVDVQVYGGAGQRILHGDSIYAGPVFTTEGPLEFTYPPFAAIVFAPLGWIPSSLWPLCTVVSTAGIGTAIVVWWCKNLHRPQWTGWVLAGFFLSQPIISTLGFGQINVVLAGMAVADIAATQARRNFRGTLVGIAAAIKLTPAFFAVWFVVRKDWVGLRNLVLGAGGATLLTACVLPADSAAYFLDKLHDTNRVGNTAFAHNAALKGVLARLHAPEFLWIILAALVLALVVLVARRVNTPLGTGALLSSSVVAFGALLLSPISWTHHWVWLPLAGVVALTRPDMVRIGAIGLVLGLVGPILFIGAYAGDPHWLLTITTSSYALYAVAFSLSAWRSAHRMVEPSPELPPNSLQKL